MFICEDKNGPKKRNNSYYSSWFFWYIVFRWIRTWRNYVFFVFLFEFADTYLTINLENSCKGLKEDDQREKNKQDLEKEKNTHWKNFKILFKIALCVQILMDIGIAIAEFFLKDVQKDSKLENWM